MENFWKWIINSVKKVWFFFLEIFIIKVEVLIIVYKNIVYLEKVKVNVFFSICLLVFLMFLINFWFGSNYIILKFFIDLDRKLKFVCIVVVISYNWFYGLK